MVRPISGFGLLAFGFFFSENRCRWLAKGCRACVNDGKGGKMLRVVVVWSFFFAAVNGALSVGLGAYAAHGMADADPYVQSLMGKATHYQMVHALALVGVGGLAAFIQTRPGQGTPWMRRWAALVSALFSLGITFFCGSLYGIALADLAVAAMAPWGGTSFILGWLAIFPLGLSLKAGIE